MAFLDISRSARPHPGDPEGAGATLDQLSEPPPPRSAGCVPRIARAVLAATGPPLQRAAEQRPAAHQAVFHVHFHIIRSGR